MISSFVEMNFEIYVHLIENCTVVLREDQLFFLLVTFHTFLTFLIIINI